MKWKEIILEAPIGCESVFRKMKGEEKKNKVVDVKREVS